MYNAALVMAEQMKAVGINAQLKVVDWPTSVQMALNTDKDWNYFFTGWGTQPALGGLDVIQFMVNPGAAYKPKGQDDPDILAAWQDMNNLPTPEGRQAAFARAQRVSFEKAYALPFGSLTKVQATRSNVQGFKPFRIPRMFNVWFTN
jgi:peptide/nickel transport system substrate-binding protein